MHTPVFPGKENLCITLNKPVFAGKKKTNKKQKTVRKVNLYFLTQSENKEFWPILKASGDCRHLNM